MVEYNNGRGKPLILHIDDVERMLVVTKPMLESIGVDSIQAASAAQGIELAKKQLPDLILMDIQMPGMDGYRATEILKADPTTKDIPIVMVTGADMKKDVEKALVVGANGYIVKPIHVDRLKAKIEEWVPLPRA